MNEELASAAAKLAKTEHPITVLRSKFQLLDLKREADRLQEVLKEGEGIFVSPTPLQPAAWWPSWLQALGRFFLWPLNQMRQRGKKRLDMQHPGDSVIQGKLAEIKGQMDKLEDRKLHGILTPITVTENYECQAHYYAVRRQVEASFPKENTTPAERKAQEEAINFTAYHALNAKKVELALKKAIEVDGQFVLRQPVQRLLTQKEARELDPRISMEIYEAYTQNFELTDDEIKK